MELLHKLTAVLFRNTSKLHSIEEDLPSTTVAVSLPPLVQPFLNSCFLIKGRGPIALIYYLRGKSHPLQDGPAFANGTSADMFSEEDSIPLTHCKGDNRWDTSELMLQLNTTTAAAQVPCNASHE